MPVDPVDGDVRLVNIDPFSFSKEKGLSGRLEIFRNFHWDSVCSGGFDLYEADLACAQLGYLYAEQVATVIYLG